MLNWNPTDMPLVRETNGKLIFTRGRYEFRSVDEVADVNMEYLRFLISSDANIDEASSELIQDAIFDKPDAHFKVVRVALDGTLWSALYSLPEHAQVRYEPGKAARPRTGCGPLTLFSKLSAARGWSSALVNYASAPRALRCYALCEATFVKSKETEMWIPDVRTGVGRYVVLADELTLINVLYARGHQKAMEAMSRQMVDPSLDTLTDPNFCGNCVSWDDHYSGAYYETKKGDILTMYGYCTKHKKMFVRRWERACADYEERKAYRHEVAKKKRNRKLSPQTVTREIIDEAVEKGIRRFIERMGRIGIPSHVTEPSDAEKFDKQLGEVR